MEELVSDFLTWLQGLGRSPKTIGHHRVSLKHWLKFLEEKEVTELAGITPQATADYQAWLYAAKSRYGKPYTLGSQIVMLNSLQGFCKYLVKTGKLLSDPSEILQMPREPKRLPGTILTSKEMKKLLSQPDISTVLGFRDRTMYEVLYSSGLRITELIRVRVQDLDLSSGVIFVDESKYCKDRYVPLGDTACRYIKEHLERVRPLLLRDGETKKIFLNRLGKPMDKSGVEKKLQIYGERAGIKKHLTVHVFRHTLATEMLKAGADLRQIQELLGHKNLRTTQLYTHVVKGELKRIQQKCHPREQTNLPDGFVKYRGNKYIKDGEEC